MVGAVDNGVIRIGALLAIAAVAPPLLSLGLSRLEPWTFEVDRLVAWRRGRPSTIAIHFAIVLGVLLTAWGLTFFTLCRRGGPSRKLSLVLVSFAATELLIG